MKLETSNLKTMNEWEQHDKAIFDRLGKCFLGLRHKIVYKKGKGYFCKRCKKPISQCH